MGLILYTSMSKRLLDALLVYIVNFQRGYTLDLKIYIIFLTM